MNQPKQKPIGVLLKELGFINEEQIEVALDVQKVNKGKYLGEILEALDFVTSREVGEAISRQLEIEFVDLENLVPETEALRQVPKDFAFEHLVLPLRLDGKELVLATTDPNNLKITDQLRRTSLRQIRYVLADRKIIADYLQLYYYQLENPIEEEVRALIQRAFKGATIDNIKLVELILNNAIKDRATDIHVTPESLALHVFYRIDGVLRHYYSLPMSLHQTLIARVKVLGSMDIAEQRVPQDGGFNHQFLKASYDARVSTLPTMYGENLVMRVLGKNASLLSLRAIGLNEDIREKLEVAFTKPYGIVLVTGPTGSGKTTTLYSALRRINALQKNVLTVEDPIEYRFSFIKQTQVNVKSGYTFAAAVRSFMRQDPDVMLVGEIRDHETAELAIGASMTGHLVLSTVHTNDAVSSIRRFQDLGIQPYMVATGLLAVVAQRLVRRVCSNCRELVEVAPGDFGEGQYAHLLPADQGDEPLQIYEARGCEHCRQTGYLGRTSIVELLEVDEEIEEMIVKDCSTLEIMRVAQSKGMRSVKEDGILKVLKGETTLAEVERVAG